jgi:pimeloyl-ACP methyl ester carboxylesterase
MIKVAICLASVLFAAAIASAAPKLDSKTRFQGFVDVSKKTSLYVDWIYAKPGKPTAVLLNGITYSTRQWDRFTAGLTAKGIGVLRYDPVGMGETLLLDAPVLEKINIAQQSRDLHALLNKLELDKPFNIVGLSYGGGLAFAFAGAYPEEVGKLIAMAPYTEPLRQQDQWIDSQVWLTRQMQPWNPSSDDELYDYFLRQLVYSTYPSVEPISLENPFKLEGIFRLAQGIRKFHAVKLVDSLPDGQLHLVIAGKDQSIAREVLTGYWASVPQAKRGSLTTIKNSGHKIPEESPKFSAALVAEILIGNSLFSNGREFTGEGKKGSLVYDGGAIRFPADSY